MRFDGVLILCMELVLQIRNYFMLPSENNLKLEPEFIVYIGLSSD